MAANDNGGETPSTRPTLDDDTWRFAKSIIREKGPGAHKVVQTRAEMLTREGNYRVAKLWRDVAEAIKWLEGMPSAEKA